MALRNASIVSSQSSFRIVDSWPCRCPLPSFAAQQRGQTVYHAGARRPRVAPSLAAMARDCHPSNTIQLPGSDLCSALILEATCEPSGQPPLSRAREATPAGGHDKLSGNDGGAGHARRPRAAAIGGRRPRVPERLGRSRAVRLQPARGPHAWRATARSRATPHASPMRGSSRVVALSRVTGHTHRHRISPFAHSIPQIPLPDRRELLFDSRSRASSLTFPFGSLRCDCVRCRAALSLWRLDATTPEAQIVSSGSLEVTARRVSEQRPGSSFPLLWEVQWPSFLYRCTCDLARSPTVCRNAYECLCV
jgi:hypothetical protein